ncbi:MAG: DUF488 family protein [Gemmatimonadales bacterium]
MPVLSVPSTSLCTIGYEKRSLDEFSELLRSSGVEVVLDVRETAWSHKPGFSKLPFILAERRPRRRYLERPAASVVIRACTQLLPVQFTTSPSTSLWIDASLSVAAKPGDTGEEVIRPECVRSRGDRLIG